MRAAGGEVRVTLALVLVPCADEQEDEPVAQPVGDLAQQRPVGAPAEMAERDRDDRAALRGRVGRGERVRGQADERRAAACVCSSSRRARSFSFAS